MIRRFNTLFGGATLFFLVCVLAPCVWAKARPWPHEKSTLDPDETIVWGKLDNGFRYAIKPVDSSLGRVSMRFVVSVGSLNEEEEERGLSHFVEHMAFSGTRNYAKGELGRFFQRLGMDFGGDVTAFTYYDRTVYHMELPRNDGGLVQQSLEVFRDYADGILFSAEDVEVERQVILRERQVRDTPESQLRDLSMNLAMEGTLVPDRSPIGTSQVLLTANSERLKAFYDKWYRADLMTLVVVGDVNTDLLEAEIERVFSGLRKPVEDISEFELGKPVVHDTVHTRMMAMEGVERFHVEALRCWAEKNTEDSWKLRERDYVRSFATELLNERVREQVDGLNSEFAYYQRSLGFPFVSFAVSVGGDDWFRAADWSDYLLRQAVKYGFTSDEIERLRESWLHYNEGQVKRFHSLEPHEIIDGLVDSIENGSVYLGIEDLNTFNRKMLRKLNRRSIKAAFRACWNVDSLNYLVAGNVEKDGDPSLIAASLHFVRLLDLPRYEPVKVKTFFADEKGRSGGVVVEEREIEGLDDAYSIRFSNNVRLSYMKTDVEAGRAHVLVRVGGGMLSYTGKNSTTHEVAMNAMFRSGFGEYSMEEVYSALRAKLDNFGFSVSEYDAFEFNSTGDEEALDLFFQVMAGYLASPRIIEDGFASARTKYRQNRASDMNGVNDGFRELQRLIFKDKGAFYEPRLEEIDVASIDESREWILPEMADGFLEVIVVGDIDKSVAIEMVSKTLGSLPKRRANKDEFKTARELGFEMPTGDYTIKYDASKGENAFAVVAWNLGDMEISIKESAALFLLSKILENRVHERVREGVGKSYSPMMSYQNMSAYDDVRFLRADIDCLSEDANLVLDMTKEIVDDFLENGLTNDELERAVMPLQDSLKSAWRDNEFLATMVLSGMYEYEDSVKYAIMYRDGLLLDLTTDYLHEVGEKFIHNERRLSVALVPGSDGVEVGETPLGTKFEGIGVE